MFLSRSSRVLRRQRQLYNGLSRVAAGAAASGHRYPAGRGFHSSQNLRVVKPVLLADIGEGIVECEIIQWFVEPGARVEEFSPLCEVQSDKASVEITSRFSGVVKKLHYDAGEMARVGKPFVDIDIQGEVDREILDALTPSEPAADELSLAARQVDSAASAFAPASAGSKPEETAQAGEADKHDRQEQLQLQPKGKCAALATPAVRHLSKELNIDIKDVTGTGRDGRVMKEDLYRYAEERDAPQPDARGSQPGGASLSAVSSGAPPGVQTETLVQLTKTQEHMFKTMTRSLTIPHFLYADEIDFTKLGDLRARLNKVLARSAAAAGQPPGTEAAVGKLSYLPFIVKAVSMALYRYPVLNARVDVDPATQKPALVLRSQHNIGVAMDTPQGLIVPVVRDVGARSVLDIAAELVRLQSLALAGRLGPQDLGGGTITVSNIGSIGGTYLSPVIVEREVAILGVGRTRAVPAFADDDPDRVVRKLVCNFSWSADHRVVDGATMARAAGVVREVVEEPDVMVMHLR
ncbi:Dihydrolipoamide acetyltransferase component of pyruvate dehydrogenase complex [Pleurostoma richardsiae]|uniref:Dihydrolipoamide acetyltransferase component of pyruvate dehydrogenase complex n=1 Tax=Pleurostoma richardsiae TaxID=41990 RepID=A0AA38RWA5_9PEZI|nr:Dihydrolipoamide acetyltransferase component of pyruvate dehydrogenase complex [Pleurostoma richardsiae]